MQDVQTLIERPKFYHNIDGVGELGLGFMLAGFTAFQWVATHARQDSIWNKVYTLLIFGALLSAVIHYGTQAIKKRITYRRTGFVSYRKKDLYWPGLIVFVMAFAVSGISSFMLRRDEVDATSFAMLVIGLLMAASYGYGIARAVRWKWVVAALVFVAAVVVALLPARVTSAPMSQSWIVKSYSERFLGSLFLYLAFYGLMMLVSGGVSFWLYLHKTRDAGVETE
jgi:uncharacterized membrane protein